MLISAFYSILTLFSFSYSFSQIFLPLTSFCACGVALLCATAVVIICLFLKFKVSARAWFPASQWAFASIKRPYLIALSRITSPHFNIMPLFLLLAQSSSCTEKWKRWKRPKRVSDSGSQCSSGGNRGGNLCCHAHAFEGAGNSTSSFEIQSEFHLLLILSWNK